jgi:hypothetical protein
MMTSVADPRAPSDPNKVAAAIVNSVYREPAPLRVTLGPDAYTGMRSALLSRLEDLEAQKGLAYSTVGDD